MKRLLTILLICLALFSAAQAAISNQTAWEVRPTLGASTNGGGYVAGTTATTTDYSQNDNKNAAACSNCGSSTQDLSTTDAVAVGTTTITSATANFVAAKGNIAYFQGGTGTITAQRREIVSVTNVTTIVLDAAIAASTGMTMNIGGSIDLLNTIQAQVIFSNKVFIKATGTHLAGTITMSAANGIPSATANGAATQIIGYTTTRGDNGIATLKVNADNIQLLLMQNSGWWIKNLEFDCDGKCTNSFAVQFSGQYGQANNIWVHDYKYTGLAGANPYMVLTNSTIGPSAATCSNLDTSFSYYSTIKRNYFHDSKCQSMLSVYLLFGSITENIFDTIDGSPTASMIQPAAGQNFYGDISFNTFYNITAANRSIAFIYWPNQSAGLETSIQGNIFSTASHTGSGAAYGIYYNISGGTNAFAADPSWDGNAFHSIQDANRFNLDDTTLNPINSVATYTNPMDKTTSTTPFVDAPNADFRLNNTATGGALLRGTAPTSCIGATGHQACTGYRDFGALQTQYGTGGPPGVASAYAQ